MMPFILWRLPGETVFHRQKFTSRTESSLAFGDVSVHLWPGCTLGNVRICPESTPREKYVSNIGVLKDKLKITGGKTVICRQICGSLEDADITEIADKYFREFPDMFCFLFFHSSVGFWMGASPELLLQTTGSNTATTRALAGTQRVDSLEPWSSKNINEHNFVVDDIMLRLAAKVPEVRATMHQRTDLKYGRIRHLCTPISLESDIRLPFDKIIAAIHPTAAVCGMPLSEASDDISALESWPRNCYGGFIKTPGPQGPIAYVMLRCVHFDNGRWTVYTGSGITADSDPDDEWNETAAKAAPLTTLLTAVNSPKTGILS